MTSTSEAENILMDFFSGSDARRIFLLYGALTRKILPLLNQYPKVYSVFIESMSLEERARLIGRSFLTWQDPLDQDFVDRLVNASPKSSDLMVLYDLHLMGRRFRLERWSDIDDYIKKWNTQIHIGVENRIDLVRTLIKFFPLEYVARVSKGVFSISDRRAIVEVLFNEEPSSISAGWPCFIEFVQTSPQLLNLCMRENKNNIERVSKKNRTTELVQIVNALFQ